MAKGKDKGKSQEKKKPQKSIKTQRLLNLG
jgi:hypothetical protein